MKIIVISLARTPDRLRAFQAMNPHIDADVFPAIDGETVRHVEFLPPSLPYTPGAIGCMLSHLALWDRVTEPVTILEDDAVVHDHFAELSAGVIAALPPDWHFCLWGYNFDAALMLDALPGVSSCVVAFDQNSLRLTLPRFRRLPLMPRPIRLLRAFGTVAYAISPLGVAALRPLCVPVRPDPVPFHDRILINDGIDKTLNAAYARVNAFAAFPPLVVTANDHTASTVLKKEPPSCES